MPEKKAKAAFIEPMLRPFARRRHPLRLTLNRRYVAQALRRVKKKLPGADEF